MTEPMPTKVAIVARAARPCSCTTPSQYALDRGAGPGVVIDENYRGPDHLSPREWMSAGAPRDLGEGLLVCGFCAGDAWVWGEVDITEMLEDLTDPDPCTFDHHGYCQAHGWLRDDRPCPHARAKALL